MNSHYEEPLLTRQELWLTTAVCLIVSIVAGAGAVYGYKAFGERYVAGLEGKRGEVVFRLAQGLALSGEGAAALDAYALATGLSFENVKNEAWCLREYGDLLSRERMFADASKALRKSIALNEKDSKAHELLCIALQNEGRSEEMAIAAIHWFSHAGSREDLGEAKFNLGIALRDQGARGQALQAFLDGHRFNPTSYNSFHAARIFESMGDEDRAIELYGAFLEESAGWRVTIAKTRRDRLLKGGKK